MPSFNRSDFSGNPVRLDMSRSRFALNHKMKTTFNSGYLIPVYSNGDILPGDTWDASLSTLIRMSTPLFPVMDDAYADVYWFFTPHKLTLSRQMMSPSVNDSNRSWKAFIGAQDSLLNMPTPSDVLLPFFYLGLAGSNHLAGEVHSLQDYLGLPLANDSQVINCLEPLAYYAVWNSYFRDENTMNPVTYSIGSVVTGSTNPDINGRAPIVLSGYDGRFGSLLSSIGNSGNILPVCRPHGYFGSALPWPQRNLSMVNISLASVAPLSIAGQNLSVVMTNNAGNVVNDGDAISVLAEGTTNPGGTIFTKGSVNGATAGLRVFVPLNANADLSQAGGISVNQLRLLVQTQRWYEALARGGNRIGEMTASMFGVTPSDLAQDRPEYLAGKRIRISMDQVANQAASLGELGAYSNTGDSSKYFTKSFDTWGSVQCFICVRTNESFTQGIARRYSRKSRFDFYWPQFANLGEQPILNKEIYVDPTAYAAKQDEVFGYQEAWAEYRYDPDQVSGYLRPDQSLGAYTYANLFSATPTLTGYMSGAGVKTNIDRTLKVPSTTSGFQFIGDFAFNIIATRPMPRYSIPGLVDHH